jgi:hypothetical protein
MNEENGHQLEFGVAEQRELALSTIVNVQVQAAISSTSLPR